MKEEKIPDFKEMFKRYNAAGVTFIGMNPEQMKTIMDAMYMPDGYVRVNFGGIDKAMILDVPGVPNQEGMVLPILVEATLF